MVRTSAVLCRIRYAWRQKDVYKKKGVYKVNHPPSLAHGILEESGVKMVDPMAEINPPPPEWNPPEEMLPDFRVKFPPKENPQKKEKPIWHLTSRISFTEGIDQACLLTKSQRFDGLPGKISQLIDKYSLEDQDEKVRDTIRHAVQYNNTNVKLPKRLDLSNVGWRFSREYGIPASKSVSIMLNNFMRLAQSFGGRFPDLTSSRRVLCKPSIETSFEFHNESVEIKCMNEYMVTDRRPLTRFGDDKLVEQSVEHKLFDMYPVNPTIDFLKTYNYEEVNRGAIKEVLEVPCSHPQIVFRINAGHRSSNTSQAFNLMTTFGIAITEARSRYGTGLGKLEVPVTVININASFDTMNFIVFQLNTMDFENDEGIKNFAWFDSEQLFTRILQKPWLEPDRVLKPPTYQDYNEKVFKKFLALYLYDYVN